MEFNLIEFFGGVGTFTMSLQKYLYQNILAYCEINKKSQQTFRLNHDIQDNQIIQNINTFENEFNQNKLEIKRPLIMTGGFPCQSFSQAGQRQGFVDVNGQLGIQMFNLIKKYLPEYIILENVSSFYLNDHYKRMEEILIEYDFFYKVLSPREINIPQKRERVYIIGILKTLLNDKSQWKQDLNNIIFEEINKQKNLNIGFTPLHNNVQREPASDNFKKAMNIWDKITKTQIGNQFPGIVYLQYAPQSRYDKHIEDKYQNNNIPSYVENYKKRTQELYNTNPKIIEKYFKQLEDLGESKYMKLEYQVKDKLISDKTTLKKCLIHSRNQQLRVKECDNYPTLTKSDPNIYIFKKEWSNIHINDCKKLQGFGSDFKMVENVKEAKSQLGNAINLQVLNIIIMSFKKIISNDEIFINH